MVVEILLKFDEDIIISITDTIVNIIIKIDKLSIYMIEFIWELFIFILINVVIIIIEITIFNNGNLFMNKIVIMDGNIIFIKSDYINKC